MKKQSIAAAGLLVVLACFLAYRLIRQWRTYAVDHRVARLNPHSSVAAPANSVVPGSGQSLNFSAIPDNHPFHVERNNVIPPDPLPMAAKVTGPKPTLMGTMGFSGNSYALMVSGNSREASVYRKVKVGEVLDGYTLVKILPDKVVMSADGSEVDVRLDEQPRPRAQNAPAQAAASDAGGRVVSMDGPAAASANVSRADPRPAPQDVPEGTIVNGKRKRLVASPFGPTIVWEDVK
jgi:hypothetical protein